jgi:hypothetical protein
MRSTITTLFLAAAVASGGCDTASSTRPATAPESNAERARREIGEAFDASGVVLREKADEFIAAARRQLQDLDKQTLALRERAAKEAGEVRDALRERLRDVEARRDEVNRKLDELDPVTPERWEKLKRGFSNAMAELQKAFE